MGDMIKGLEKIHVLPTKNLSDCLIFEEIGLIG